MRGGSCSARLLMLQRRLTDEDHFVADGGRDAYGIGTFQVPADVLYNGIVESDLVQPYRFRRKRIKEHSI